MDEEQLFIPEVVANTRHWLASQGVDPDTPMECEVCGEPVPLWEAVYVHVMYHTLLSHLVCPKDAVMKMGQDHGLNPDFDFDSFLDEIFSMCELHKGEPEPVAGELSA